MISRKERRVQEALGLGDDIPPTICNHIRHVYKWWWYNYVTIHTYKWLHCNAFWQWLAFRLPKKLVYHCAIRIWAHATTCPSGCNETVHETTVDNAIRRWEKE